MFTCAADLQCDAAKPPTSSAHHSREQRSDATDMATIRHAHLFPLSCHRHKIGLTYTIDIET
jgi:hypothetical protein